MLEKLIEQSKFLRKSNKIVATVALLGVILSADVFSEKDSFILSAGDIEPSTVSDDTLSTEPTGMEPQSDDILVPDDGTLETDSETKSNDIDLSETKFSVFDLTRPGKVHKYDIDNSSEPTDASEPTDMEPTDDVEPSDAPEPTDMEPTEEVESTDAPIPNGPVTDDYMPQQIINGEEPFVSDALSLVEMEAIARYIFGATDEFTWKECVCTIFCEGGVWSEEEGYNVTSTVLNHMSSGRFKANSNGNLHYRLTSGGFSAYQGSSNYFSFLSMDLDSLREYPAYTGIVKCLYSQKLSHNFAQFRAPSVGYGIQFTNGGNRYLDPVTDYLSIGDRAFYQKFLEIMNNKDSELYQLLEKAPVEDVECLRYFYDFLIFYKYFKKIY